MASNAPIQQQCTAQCPDDATASTARTEPCEVRELPLSPEAGENLPQQEKRTLSTETTRLFYWLAMR
jgi:hypothetical protein